MYTIGGVEMKYPLIIGAGACKTPASVLPYMRRDVPVGAVSTGSYTPDPSTGNTGILFYPENFSEFVKNGFGSNSLGMPNMGCNQAAIELTRYAFMHPVIASVAATFVEGFVTGIQAFHGVPCVRAIKLNVGCPNKAERPVPIAYDLDFLFRIFQAVQELMQRRLVTKPIWLKLSPYITLWQRNVLQALHPRLDFSNTPVVEPEFLAEVLGLVSRYPFIRAVIFSNTLPNVIFRDEFDNPVTTPNGGKAGLSGSILKQITIDLIRQAETLLPEGVDRIGSGGVLSGDDAVDIFEAGGKAACVTSGPFWYGDGARFCANLLSESERFQNYLTQLSQSQED